MSAGFFQTTLGKKSVVAVTGAILLGFLVGHVAGNLKVFLPDPEPGVRDIDVYAEFLRSMGEPMLPHGGALWTFRLILIVALVGTQLGVITEPMQAAFVIAALVTTLMTSPAVDLFLPSGAVGVAGAQLLESRQPPLANRLETLEHQPLDCVGGF